MSIFGPSEDLNMNYNIIHNVGNPRERQDAATKAYVDSRPPLITIWAEESGPLNKDRYEWSFGNGATGRSSGYTMITDGKILAASLTTNVGFNIEVAISVNRVQQPGYEIQSLTKLSAVKIFENPLEIKAGSVINFVTKTDSDKATASVIALLIQLDLQSVV